MLPNLDEIGRRRRLLAMSQKELAKLSGVTQSMIAKIERNQINPSYQKTKAIFDTLESLERRNQLKARDVCHAKVVSLQALEPVSKGVRVMRETGYSQLPIFNGAHVVGSLTEKVILQSMMSTAKPDEVSRQSVEKIMEEAFPTVSEETPLSTVSALLQYEPAVLVASKGRIYGIITKADLLKVVGRRS